MSSLRLEAEKQPSDTGKETFDLLKNEIDRLNTELRSARNENELIKETKEASISELQRERKRLDQKVNTANHVIEYLEGQKIELEDSLSQMQISMEDEDRSGAASGDAKRVREQEKENQALKEENQALEGRIQALRKTARDQGFKIIEQEKRNRALEEKFHAMENLSRGQPSKLPASSSSLPPPASERNKLETTNMPVRTKLEPTKTPVNKELLEADGFEEVRGGKSSHGNRSHQRGNNRGHQHAIRGHQRGSNVGPSSGNRFAALTGVDKPAASAVQLQTTMKSQKPPQTLPSTPASTQEPVQAQGSTPAQGSAPAVPAATSAPLSMAQVAVKPPPPVVDRSVDDGTMDWMRMEIAKLRIKAKAEAEAKAEAGETVEPEKPKPKSQTTSAKSASGKPATDKPTETDRPDSSASQPSRSEKGKAADSRYINARTAAPSDEDVGKVRKPVSKEEVAEALHREKIDWSEEAENPISHESTNMGGASPATGDQMPIGKRAVQETPSPSQADHVPQDKTKAVESPSTKTDDTKDSEMPTHSIIKGKKDFQDEDKFVRRRARPRRSKAGGKNKRIWETDTSQLEKEEPKPEEGSKGAKDAGQKEV